MDVALRPLKYLHSTHSACITQPLYTCAPPLLVIDIRPLLSYSVKDRAHNQNSRAIVYIVTANSSTHL